MRNTRHETLEQYLYRTHTRKSAKTYAFTIAGFLATNPKAKDYAYPDIVRHFVGLATRYPKVSTRNGILSAIKRYYDYLVESGARQDHPCKTFRVKGDNIAKRKQVQFQDLFTPGELDLLLDRENRYPALRTRNKVILSLLIYQGLTSEDITRLDVKDFSPDSGTVYIKGSAKLDRRTLQLNRMQVEWIRDYLEKDRAMLAKVKSTRLLFGLRGDPETVEGIGGLLEPLKALFPERPLNAKTIRMSVVANWLNVYKHRLEDVQVWAGHKWPSSTLRYKRADLAGIREKVNRWHPLG